MFLRWSRCSTARRVPRQCPPELSWFSPFGLTTSEIAAGVILCIFIYWGWDSCLAVTEETKDADKTPGRAALLSTVILLLTYFSWPLPFRHSPASRRPALGLRTRRTLDDVLTVVGEPVLGAVMASVLLLTVAVSAAASTQTTILPTARGTLAMAVYGAIPRRFAQVHPRYKTPSFGTMVMGITAIAFYLVLSLISANALADSIASLGLAVAFYYGIVAFSCVWYFRRTLFTSARHFFMRGLLPLLGWHRHGCRLHHQREGHARSGVRLHRLRPDRRRLRDRHRHARPRGAAHDRLRRTIPGLLPRRNPQ